MKRWKRLLFLIFGLWIEAGMAWAGNDALAQTQMVPAGERVASYLQTMLTVVGQMLIIKRPTGLVVDKYQPTVLYDPQNKAVEISLIGTYNDIKLIKALLDFTREEVLSLNKKLQANFGVTLSESDLEMSYLNVVSNKTLLSYKNGEYSQKFSPEPSPEPVKKEEFGMPGDKVNGNP